MKEFVCEKCGQVVSNVIYVDCEEMSICEECIGDLLDVVECHECGEFHYQDDCIYIDSIGYFLCEGCCNYLGVELCDDCRTYHLPEDIHTVYQNMLVCTECLEGYFFCRECDEYVPGECVRYSAVYDDYICEDCYYSVYVRCDSCGNIYREDDLYIEYDEETDSYFCSECGFPSRRLLSNYSYKPSPIFRDYIDGKITNISSSSNFGSLFMGFELEVDEGYVCEDSVNEILNIRNGCLYCKEDGSLGDNGMEIVSHPCTLSFYKNTNIIRNIRDICRRYDFLSDQTDTCGFHVHVNRTFFGSTEDEQDLHIAKLILLVSRFYDSHLMNFSRRRGGTRWSAKNNLPTIYEDDADSVISRKIKDTNRERYRAINIQNYHTVEFRLFKGSLNTTTIMASLQFVDTICRVAKDISMSEAMTIKWVDIFNAEKQTKDDNFELLDYLQIRNLLECTNEEEIVTKIAC